MKRLLVLAILVLASLAAQASAQEISVQDTPLPDASTYGIDSTRFPHVGFKGMTPQTLPPLLESIPSPLGPGLGRDILIALLTMPVYPDSVEALPPGWFTYRIDRMIRLGAYTDALRLVGGLPENLRDETSQRRYVDLALTIGDIDAACKRTQEHLSNPSTPVDNYWSLRQIFCHKVEKKDEQAELMLAVYREQFAGLQTVATSILSDWGSRQSTLPPFTASDAESVPLIVAAIKHARSSKANDRLSAGFMTEKEIPSLTPAFAMALGERDVFPLSERISMLARAVASGAADPTVLREALEQARPTDGLPPEYRVQATLIADINATQSEQNKTSVVANALSSFKRSYTPYIARGMFTKELESFAQHADSTALTPELAMDMAAYFIERGNSSRAEDVLRMIEGRAAGDESFAIALAAVRSALYYNRQLGSEQQPQATMIPAFSTPQRPGVMWILRRLVMVQKAMGVEVPDETEILSRNAPLPDTASPSPVDMLALEQAESDARDGELVLRCVQLTGNGALAYVSDEVFARCIHAMQKTGQTTYAAAFAQAAIMNPPVAPLQVGGTMTPGMRP